MTAGASFRVALACALAAGCASPQRPSETPGALARPELDPACHGTVQGLLETNGLEEVVVRLSVDRAGRVELVEVLSPDLTPVAKVELQRAMASCVGAPVPAEGTAEVFTTTWVREAR